MPEPPVVLKGFCLKWVLNVCDPVMCEQLQFVSIICSADTSRKGPTAAFV